MTNNVVPWEIFNTLRYLQKSIKSGEKLATDDYRFTEALKKERSLYRFFLERSAGRNME